MRKILTLLSPFLLLTVIFYVNQAGAVSKLDSESVFFNLSYEQKQGLAPETPLESVSVDGDIITLSFAKKDVTVNKNEIDDEFGQLLEGMY